MVISGRERQPKECKIKVKMPPFHAMEVYRGSSVHSECQHYMGLSGPLHSFVTSAVNKCHNTHWTGCWFSPEVSLDVKAKRKILPLLGTKP